MTACPRRTRRVGALPLGAVLGAALGVTAACQPTVQVAAPEKPIVINLNVKIEHEVRVKLEKDVDNLLKKNSDLF
ncbi:MAG: YnbE family lipoprotein [Rhodospirillales bacterium CG15_BIG_FIL_POST_REV_8_21_14_020_66_15]|nr:MAG: YnbE family lipoprotein [Rhodospirillales bacterium CG15_BIG_FIL_POST_REV_8_21_14_020_66_15]